MLFRPLSSHPFSLIFPPSFPLQALFSLPPLSPSSPPPLSPPGLSRDYPGTVPGLSRPFPEISWELCLCVSLFSQEKGKHINNLTLTHFRDNPAKLFMFIGFFSPPKNSRSTYKKKSRVLRWTGSQPSMWTWNSRPKCHFLPQRIFCYILIRECQMPL